MNIVVPVIIVPDLVEELEVDESGIALDRSFLRLILNELDEHAIEQSILLKEAKGAQVTILAPETDGVEDILFTAAAKGADQLVKLTGDIGLTSHSLAQAFAGAIVELEPDLVLTGVQAHDSLDGTVGPQLAETLGMPYVGYVSGVEVTDGKCTVKKEYPGGVIAEIEVQLPAVLGIQAAEKPPRYVAISKTRQAMKSTTIEERGVESSEPAGAPVVTRMLTPEAGEQAEMLSGDEEEIAEKIVQILKDRGLL